MPIPFGLIRNTIMKKTKPIAPPITPLRMLGCGKNPRLPRIPGSGNSESTARITRAAMAAG